MISAIGNRSFLMKSLFCVFSLLLLAGSAAAWEESFEGNTLDLPTSSFTYAGYAGYGVTACEHGSAFSSGTLRQYNVDWAIITIPYYVNDYLAYSVKSPSPGNIKIGAEFLDADNHNLITISSYMYATGVSSNQWYRVEWKENAGKTGIELYINGAFQATYTYLESPKPNIVKVKIKVGAWNSDSSCYIDDITTSSSQAILSMDEKASVTDTAQYFRLGVVPPSTGKSYIVKVLSPHSYSEVKEYNLTSASLTEQALPISELNDVVGDYTLHLYRHDTPTSEVFLCMKTFELYDPAGSGEGTLQLDKAEYEAGDTVGAWVHLDNYADGYLIRCDFETGGSNFKKEVKVTSNPFYGTFTIPDISNVIGGHTVQLIDPSGQLVDSEVFNVYIPGLPDIALNKDLYERTDKAIIYYKDVKPGSTITVVMRYGGSTAQTVDYSVSGTGSLSIDLSALPSADSIYVSLKDADGWFDDDDNADIVVGNFLISGRVYDAKTGAALQGATVTIQGNVTNSDNNGNYNLSALAGFANYSVVKTGYNSITGTVAIFDLETVHSFYMSPVLSNAGTGVYGTVVSSKTDYPLTGASVEVTNNDNGKRFSTIVNSFGYYSLASNDLAGNITIRVSFDNYDSVVSSDVITLGNMNNHNYRLNAVTGYEEIDPSEHTGGQDSANPGETAEEKAYREKFGEMGKHPFDFNGDGTVENSEWKYAGERFIMLIGILAFMGFLMLINRRR